MYFQSYQDYLSSDRWRQIARRRLEIDSFRCQMCGSHGTRRNPLQIHHLSYRRIFSEDPYKDLVCLCADCHRAVHTMMNRKTSADGRRGWKDTLPNLVEPEPITDFDFE